MSKPHDLTPLLGQTVTVEMMTKTGLKSITGTLRSLGAKYEALVVQEASMDPDHDPDWTVMFWLRQASSIDHDKKLITLKGVGQ